MRTRVSNATLILVLISLVTLPALGGYLLKLILSKHLLEILNLSVEQVVTYVALSIFFVLSVYFIFSIRRNECWCLSGARLERGRPVNLVIDLDEISEFYCCYDSGRKFLALKLSEQTIFTLELYSLGNGMELMQRVEEILADKKMHLEQGARITKFLNNHRGKIRKNKKILIG